MASYARYVLRGDTSANWESKNPVLLKNEIGYDMTAHYFKMGDGTSTWKNLPYIRITVTDNLTTSNTVNALSANQGKVLKGLIDGKADTTTVNNLETRLTQFINNSKVTVENNLTSTSTTNALSANQGRVLKGLIDSKTSVTVINNLTNTSTTAALSANQGKVLKELVDAKASKTDINIFGIGYTVNSFNAYKKPTKITFSDGVIANLTWNGTQLNTITASTGEKITINYDNDGLITGRTVTKG